MSTAVATAPPRPTRAEMVPFGQAIKDPKTPVGSLLQHPEMMARMRQTLPRHLSPERMLRVCALALQRTPKLAQCDRMTLLGALLTCGSLGLEPNTVLGHAYLIPFGQSCTLIIGYKGFVDLARRSGAIATVHADVVYQGDEFDFEYGSNGRLKHVPSGAREGDWLYAYAYARMKDGSDQYEVMTRNEVLRIRNGSQGYMRDKAKSPWALHEAEMAKKTALRRLAKWLPLSVEFATAAALDEMADAGRADLSGLGEATDVLGGVESMTFSDQTPEEGAPLTETVTQAATQLAASAETPAAAEPAREEADPAVIPVASLIAGLELCTTSAELTAYWRDIDEAKANLPMPERQELNAKKAAMEIALTNREKAKR